MPTELKKHSLAYGVLIFGLIIAGLAFMMFWPHRMYQRLVIGALMVFYVGWGSVTHFKSRHLTRGVLLEYISVAVLGGVLLFLITL